ncbi:sulfotransferase family protein [Orenia marismortui]|uniref:sulfotransferase family protein n=1 Tax=Orenia marismortui TaxID=46469 RepID=UPI000367CDD7|nr:sulfotransferase [Orenia marismortui]
MTILQDENIRNKKIFILGTGRSGTHWLAYILANHPNIRATIEEPIIFDLVTKMALNEDLRAENFPKLIKLYCEEAKKSFPKDYLDKSHPNLWLAEDLAQIFPRAFFIAIQRNPYATVASMLKHQGVLYWHKNWRDFPVPNSFLGIDKSNVEQYEDLSITTQCALRWRAHKERLEYLQDILGSKLHVVYYRDLIVETERELNKLNEFLELSIPLARPRVKEASLNKWRLELSAQECQEIEKVVRHKADYYYEDIEGYN